MMFPHSVRIAAVTVIAVVLAHRSEAQEQPFTPQVALRS